MVVKSDLMRLFLSTLMLACVLLGFGRASDASAESLDLRSYGQADGLTALGNGCLLQAPDGYILLCSLHGLFVYNGRRFVNLGPAQGLRDGGVVYDIAFGADQRLYLRYPDDVYVSDQPVGPGRSPTSLTFRRIGLKAGSLFDEQFAQMASWSDGVAIIASNRLMSVRAGVDDLIPMGFSVAENRLLRDPSTVTSIRGVPWLTFVDRVCAAAPGHVRCYGSADGLVGGPWLRVQAGQGDDVAVRSATMFATIDRHGQVHTEPLPFQAGLSDRAKGMLSIFRDPLGRLMTQAKGGLIRREHDGWRLVLLKEDVAAGVIVWAGSDQTGQFWISVLDRGLFRAIGYGHWDMLRTSDGLSNNTVWGIKQARDGSLWVANDSAVDQFVRGDGGLRVARTLPGSSDAIVIGSHDKIWMPDGRVGARSVDPATGATTRLVMPPVFGIAAAGPRIWFGTEHGLFFTDEVGDHQFLVQPGLQVRSRVDDLAADGEGGVWFLTAGHLLHRSASGTVTVAVSQWPAGGFQPLCIAVGRDRTLWVGGAGGLYHLVLSNEHLVALEHVGPSNTISSTVLAATLDHRGWLWIGTSSGVSVFDGTRWVSANMDTGLVWNDVSEGAITEDRDGSIWIGTSNGLSHLVDPTWLLRSQPISVMISDAWLGDGLLPQGRLPYSATHLSFQFGTSSYAAEKSIVFRYRMSGIDQAWAETSTGMVRYPFVPPGRHTLTVIGYDTLTHQSSTPVSLTISMSYPWWRQWWAESGVATALAILIYAGFRLRYRRLLSRQKQLERMVEDRTRDMRAAQASLLLQATRDGLTGLLNRAEVEKQLAQSLVARDDGDDLVIGLVDLDHFKGINDHYGHLGGDDILQEMGARIREMLRAGEFAGRYGGEEVLVVLDDDDGEAAARMLSFHRAFREQPFVASGRRVSVTCSIGVAWARRGDDWKSLIGRADDALYQAKRAGRDRVVEERNGGLSGTSALVSRIHGAGPGARRSSGF